MNLKKNYDLINNNVQRSKNKYNLDKVIYIIIEN